MKHSIFKSIMFFGFLGVSGSLFDIGLVENIPVPQKVAFFITLIGLVGLGACLGYVEAKSMYEKENI